MDGLIALLIVIAVVNALTSSKKKKQARKRAAAQPEVEAAQAQSAAPKSPSRVPYTREERAEYMREIRPDSGARPAASVPTPAQPLMTEPTRPSAPRGGEGSVSTQGESAAEHAGHLRRAAAEEDAQRQQRELLRDLRAANRERLQAAVVMGEVLGKPVSLRRRGLPR